MSISVRPFLVAVFLLATGCRSEKVAFDFRAHADQPTAVSREASVQTEQPATATLPRLSAPGAAIPVGPAVARRLLHAPHLGPGAALTLAAPVAKRSPLQLPRHAATQAHVLLEGKNFHLLLGAALAIGGVIAGLLIGGWLGFGVGTLIVLLGYYFLGLAIGGPHAWLGVFQELFNM